MNLPINLTDVVFAAFFAGVIVLIIRVAGRMFHALITRSVVISLGVHNLDPEERESLMQRIYNHFPIETLKWDGTTFWRGSILRVVNDKDETFEGQFIGLNEDNMVCLFTNDSVIAQQMKSITDIRGV